MAGHEALDEARLRELAVRCQKAKRDNARWEALDALENACTPDTILALLDALSAERKRGDRAVGLLDEVSLHAATVMRYLEEDGASIVAHLMDTDDNPGQRLRDAIALATQKAEGA